MTPSPEVVWELPEPLSIAEVLLHHDAAVILRRHGNPNGPRLVLSHGNGLAIDLYFPFWSLLLGDFDVVVYDLRNHGWNSLGYLADHTVPNLVQDFEETIEAIDEHFGRKPRVGVFHSISALISLLSPRLSSGFEALALFDPPLCRLGSTYQISVSSRHSQRGAGETPRQLLPEHRGAGGSIAVLPILPAGSPRPLRPAGQDHVAPS